MKKVLPIAVVIVGVVALGGFVLAKKNSSTNTSTDHSAPSQVQTNSADQPESASSESDTDASQDNEVVMRNLAYSPGNITIKKGTTVTWTNNDSVQHDVTPDNPTDEFKKSALFGKGGTYSVTFNTPGTYAYHCTPHPFMKGTVTVTE